MKKAFSIIKSVFIWAIVALAVFMMIFTIISVTTFNRNDRDLFGYKAYIVNSNSMAATDFKAGDLVFVKETPASELKEGDIITFISQDSDSFGEVITHKIRKITTDANGDRGFVTYGTTTGEDDKTIVTDLYVLGKYTSHLKGVGTFFNFLKTPQGYFVCIFIPFMALIIYQGINCVRLFKRYKDEQNAQIKAERDELIRMKEELQALKSQIDSNTKENTDEVQND